MIRSLVSNTARGCSLFNKQTGECKNKMDEDQIVKREAHLLKHLLYAPESEQNNSERTPLTTRVRGNARSRRVVREIYAVKATHESDLSVKRRSVFSVFARLGR